MLGWSVREGVCLRRKRMFPVCAWHCSGPSDIHFRLSFLILYSRVQSTRTGAPLLSKPTFVDTVLLRALFDGPRYVINLDVKLHPNLAHMALLESYQCVIMQYLHFRGFQKLSHSPEYTRTLHIDNHSLSDSKRVQGGPGERPPVCPVQRQNSSSLTWWIDRQT